MLHCRPTPHEPGSQIININSVNSILGFPENPGYGAAKGGLRIMTKALAVDYGAFRHSRQCARAGLYHTDMTQEGFADPETARTPTAAYLSRPLGSPEDLVGTAIFLASDAVPPT